MMRDLKKDEEIYFDYGVGFWNRRKEAESTVISDAATAFRSLLASYARTNNYTEAKVIEGFEPLIGLLSQRPDSFTVGLKRPLSGTDEARPTAKRAKVDQLKEEAALHHARWKATCVLLREEERRCRKTDGDNEGEGEGEGDGEDEPSSSLIGLPGKGGESESEGEGDAEDEDELSSVPSPSPSSPPLTSPSLSLVLSPSPVPLADGNGGGTGDGEGEGEDEGEGEGEGEGTGEGDDGRGVEGEGGHRPLTPSQQQSIPGASGGICATGEPISPPQPANRCTSEADEAVVQELPASRCASEADQQAKNADSQAAYASTELLAARRLTGAVAIFHLILVFATAAADPSLSLALHSSFWCRPY
jgi:hypothetical protein